MRTELTRTCEQSANIRYDVSGRELACGRDDIVGFGTEKNTLTPIDKAWRKVSLTPDEKESRTVDLIGVAFVCDHKVTQYQP